MVTSQHPGWAGRTKALRDFLSQTFNIWHIYLHEWLIYGKLVGKYTIHWVSGVCEKLFSTLSTKLFLQWDGLHEGFKKFQQTPGTYPRPSTTCLWRKSFHIGIFRYQTDCCKGLDFLRYIYICRNSSIRKQQTSKVRKVEAVNYESFFSTFPLPEIMGT